MRIVERFIHVTLKQTRILICMWKHTMFNPYDLIDLYAAAQKTCGSRNFDDALCY